MIACQTRHTARLLNTLLRLAILSTKLALTLYMGRYLSLPDIGTYGLVFGAVMILTAVLGFRFDYIVSRDLVRTTPVVAVTKMRDQMLFYIMNYFAAALIAVAVMKTGVTGIDSRVLFYILALTVTSSYVDFTYININSMERPLLASMLNFVATGLWCVPVIGLGIVAP